MKKIQSLLLIFISTLFLFTSCDKPSSVLNIGIWRGALITESGSEIPFNFEVVDSSGKKHLNIFNSAERFRVNEISIIGDSIHIQMPLFDSEINGVLIDGNITGVWTKHLADTDMVMQFYAEAGIDWRIKKEFEKPAAQVTGKWATTFISSDGKDTTIAIGEFVQSDAKVTGTFLTSTGDYRYLDGILDGNKLMISTFDGSHAYLFTATLNGDKLIDGKFYYDFSSLETWSAVKDEKAKLLDAYGLTVLKAGEKKINFTFPNLDQKMISLNDPQFNNKVVVLQMLGSWCPNCMDETAYLSKFYDRYKAKGVEVVGLAYERTRDFDKSKKNIERLKNRFNVKYNLLVTGFTKDKEDAAKSLPMLNKVIAFPTMIIIDKKGEVRKIHTGFSGPGTGNHYIEFVNEFEKLINDLLKES